MSRTLLTAALLLAATAAQAADGWESDIRIRATAGQYAARQAPPGAEVSVGTLDERLKLPACEQELQADVPSGNAQRGAITVPVRCEGKSAWTVYVPVRISQKLQVVVLTRALTPGSVITADAVRTLEQDSTALPFGYLTQPELAVGKVLKRSLAAGNVLTPDALASPVAIKRGERVTLIGHAGAIEVRADGKALANAAAGERVRVENGASRRVVEGVAREGNIVEVNL